MRSNVALLLRAAGVAAVLTAWSAAEVQPEYGRLPAKPAGSYTVEGRLSTGKSRRKLQRWEGEVEGIEVEVGKGTAGVLIEVSPKEAG